MVSKIASAATSQSASPLPLAPRQLREALGLPRIRTAVEGECSEPSVRVYEINRAALKPKIRDRLDLVYAVYAERVARLAA